MTMYSYRYFVCRNGHEGEEKISENDQPYSKHWENVEFKGMRPGEHHGGDQEHFVCEHCGAEMAPRQ